MHPLSNPAAQATGRTAGYATSAGWFRYALKFRGSVIPAVLDRTLVCTGFAMLIAVLHHFKLPVSLPVLASLIPNIVLGLMLVFRTNTAYERFWEGRKLWGGLVNATRNLARHIWVVVPAPDPSDRQEKSATLYLLVAFSVATKLHLRQQPIDEELAELLSGPRYSKLKTMNNPPLEIAFWIQDYLERSYADRRLSAYQLATMQGLLNQLVDYLGGCERILKTPIPMAYAIHLKQLLLIYCLTLPMQFVSQLGWLTAPMVFLISFMLFGIEQIGIEIENPFGCDSNDLPLDQICKTMRRNVEDLMTLEPSSSQTVHISQNLASN
ncbi:MAG: bestrophin family protein [Elainella sp.]